MEIILENKRLTVEKGKLIIEWNQLSPNYYGNEITLKLSPDQVKDLVSSVQNNT